MPENSNIEHHFSRVTKYGDRESFKVIFEHYYPVLCNYSLRYLNDPELARDLVSDVFLKLWKTRESIVIRSSLRAYFFTAVRNSVYNYYRDHSGEFTVLENYQIQSTHSKPDELFEFEETNKHIQSAIEKLPMQCKKVFLLNRYEGKKYREIAAQLNISQKAVEAQISRALKLLHTEVPGYLPALALLIFPC